MVAEAIPVVSRSIDPPAGWLTSSFYNPGLIARDVLIKGFTARTSVLEDLLTIVRKQPAKGPYQHVMLTGPRGMGKTTLLLRLRYAIEDDPELAKRWQPVSFPEEGYDIGDVADLWLATLEAISGTTDDLTTAELADDLRAKGLDADALEAAALDAIHAYVKRTGRRLVLLLDNFDMLLSQIADDAQQYRLRQVLMSDPSLLLIGAAPVYFGVFDDAQRPFFEFFREIRLRPLSETELGRMLEDRGIALGAQHVVEAIHRDPGRIRGLWLLTGGNPRLSTMIFALIHERPFGTIRRDLDRLLEEVTPFYKHRVEELPIQARRVFDAIAKAWDPVGAK